MDSSERRIEEERLRMVIGEIGKQIAARKASLDDEAIENARATKQAWEEEIPVASSEFEDTVAMATETERAEKYQRFLALATMALGRLERLASSPYFGRIDFRGDASGAATKLYIGLSSLVDSESGAHLVLDWRAPVSSMFYDCEIGPAGYKSARGTVTGTLLLKRQFRIEDGVMRLMFDNSLKIDDEILQEVLGRATGDRMRAIVNTIQKEQNRIIRDEDHKVLIVQGVAGSGKTSIALHRAAYLLYRHRETIRSENIVIFSPNRVFADYIGAVLPELGESNVFQTTWREFAYDILGERLSLEDVHDQLEYLVSQRTPAIPSLVRDETLGQDTVQDDYLTRREAIEWKSSFAFAGAMTAYADYLSKTVKLRAIEHGGEVVASLDHLRELVEVDYAYMPLHRRLDKVRRRVLRLLQPFEEKRRREIQKELIENKEKEFHFENEIPAIARMRAAAEFQDLRNELAHWGRRDAVIEYRRLWEDEKTFSNVFGKLAVPLPSRLEEIRKLTALRLSEGFVPYEDQAPLLLLKYHLDGFNDSPEDDRSDVMATRRRFPYRGARHVIVDESQDYSAPQYEVLKNAFALASMTFLGDLNQSVHPNFAISDYGVLKTVFRDHAPALVSLEKSYRTTREIALFSAALLPAGTSIEALDRPGTLPTATLCSDESGMLDAVAEDLAALSRESFRSIAVICKTATESQHVYGQLQKALKGRSYCPGIRLVRAKDRRFSRGAVVIPSYLAKGLEFEAALIYGADRMRYSHPDDLKLLHMVCTRALHRLHLYADASLSAASPQSLHSPVPPHPPQPPHSPHSPHSPVPSLPPLPSLPPQLPPFVAAVDPALYTLRRI